MGRLNFSLGHVEGTSSRPKLVYDEVETSGKGLLILLANLAAAAAAFWAVVNSLCHRKK